MYLTDEAHSKVKTACSGLQTNCRVTKLGEGNEVLKKNTRASHCGFNLLLSDS